MAKARDQAAAEAKRIAALNDTTDANKKIVLSALIKTRGNVSKACEAAGISRGCFYEWVKEDAEFANGLKDAREKTVDAVEDALHKLIQEGNPTATIFFLKSSPYMGERRYREGIDVSGEGGKDLFPSMAPMPIQVKIIKTTE